MKNVLSALSVSLLLLLTMQTRAEAGHSVEMFKHIISTKTLEQFEEVSAYLHELSYCDIETLQMKCANKLFVIKSVIELQNKNISDLLCAMQEEVDRMEDPGVDCGESGFIALSNYIPPVQIYIQQYKEDLEKRKNRGEKVKDKRRALELLSALSFGGLNGVRRHQAAVADFDEKRKKDYFSSEEGRLNYINDKLKEVADTWDVTCHEEDNRAWIYCTKKTQNVKLAKKKEGVG